MKILERATMPDGTEIQLEDWRDKNDDEYPDLYGLQIGAYPIARRRSASGWVQPGERFKVTVSESRYQEYGAKDVEEDFAALKSGEKRLSDLASHFWNGEKDKWLLGMESLYNDKQIWR